MLLVLRATDRLLSDGYGRTCQQEILVLRILFLSISRKWYAQHIQHLGHLGKLSIF